MKENTRYHRISFVPYIDMFVCIHAHAGYKCYKICTIQLQIMMIYMCDSLYCDTCCYASVKNIKY